MGLEKGKHRSAWLITYADLMTILVCFFVLIISYSVQDLAKLEVVAGSLRDAFGVTDKRRYAGEVELDGTPEKRQPGNIKPAQMPTADGLTDSLAARPNVGDQGRHGAFENQNADNRRRLHDAREALEKAILTHPLLKDSADAITINLIEDGMQIILVDQTGAPMFELGDVEPTARAQILLRETASILSPLPNRIFIEGHADATGAGAYSPFDLTSARANAARRILEAAGFPEDRIAGVSGRAAAAPLFPEDPYKDANRRIEIVLEPAAPLLPSERSL